jgi:transposase, IS5 family
MLRQRYEVDKEFSILIQLFGEMDDSMLKIDKILIDEQLFKLIESDLSLRYPKTTKTGRLSTPVEVILRMLVLKHLRGLSYEKVIVNVHESLILRQFCRIYFHPIPDKSTLIRWSNQINHKTLKEFNQRLTVCATQLKITQGQRLRTDGTVVATNIHFPSDNTLLVDSVRVMSRLLLQVKEILEATSTSIDKSLFRNRLRTARRISRSIDSLSKTRNKSGSQKRQQAYSKLIKLTQASFKQAEKVQKLQAVLTCHKRSQPDVPIR